MPVDNSGRVYVVGSVPVLRPEAQTVDEMLEGWRNRQLCRNLDRDTIARRVWLVGRFIEHTNENGYDARRALAGVCVRAVPIVLLHRCSGEITVKIGRSNRSPEWPTRHPRPKTHGAV